VVAGGDPPPRRHGGDDKSGHKVEKRHRHEDEEDRIAKALNDDEQQQRHHEHDDGKRVIHDRFRAGFCGAQELDEQKTQAGDQEDVAPAHFPQIARHHGQLDEDHFIPNRVRRPDGAGTDPAGVRTADGAGRGREGKEAAVELQIDSADGDHDLGRMKE